MRTRANMYMPQSGRARRRWRSLIAIYIFSCFSIYSKKSFQRQPPITALRKIFDFLNTTDELPIVQVNRLPASQTSTRNSSAHAIRKGTFSAFPLLTQLTLLIYRRSAHSLAYALIHASMICAPSGLWLNCYSNLISQIFYLPFTSTLLTLL